MIKTIKTLRVAVLAAMVLGSGMANAKASSETCVPIGGTALGQFFNEGKDVIGAMSGTWSATRGKVVSQKKTTTGISLEMEHAFSTREGGVVLTRDKIALTTAPGKKDSYLLDIAYNVAKSFGHLKGYSGTFYSKGRLDMDSGEAVVRYRGKLCK